MRKKVLILTLCLLVCGCGQKIANIDSTGENIICFGDSLTSGEGASAGADYPSVLSRKLNLRVINAGHSGDTTNDALRRIEKDVLEKRPRMVIVCFAGNDFLKQIPPSQTFENLEKIVSLIQQTGAMAVLVHVRLGLFADEYLRLFRKIARARKALLVPDILKGIFEIPELKSDRIHPNDAGYEIMAERIYKAIRPLLER